MGECKDLRDYQFDDLDCKVLIQILHQLCFGEIERFTGVVKVTVCGSDICSQCVRTNSDSKIGNHLGHIDVRVPDRRFWADDWP